MSQVRRINQFIHALDEDDGARVDVDADGFVTLGVDTYFFPVGLASDAGILGIEIQTDSAIAGTFSVEATCFPKDGVPTGQQFTDWDDSATSPWVKDDSAVNAFVSTNGTGWTPTVLTLVKTAGVGNAIYSLAGRGGMRYRVRADVTTGGKVRVAAHGKS